MKQTPPPKQMNTMRFIVVAALLMLLADHFIFDGTRGYIEEAKDGYRAEHPQEFAPPEIVVVPEEPIHVAPGTGQTYFEGPETVAEEFPVEEHILAEEAPVVTPPVKQDTPLPDVVMPKNSGARMRVAIVIDDLGLDLKRSREVMELPSPITLAFLPYGAKTKEYAAIGKSKGHPLIIHTPMEAMDAKQNIGPGGLRANMDEATFQKNFEVMLQSFDGYGGINNHMGSRLTQDEVAMARVMKMLKERGLFFVDSKTISTSVAANEARRAGVPYAVRNVFLDHENTRAFVDGALLKVENEARRNGTAIAIGHPKDATIAGLKAWIPTLKAKGIDLVPVSDLLIRPKGSVVVEKAVEVSAEVVPEVVTEDVTVEAPAVAEDAPTMTDAAPVSLAPLKLQLEPQIQLPAIY